RTEYSGRVHQPGSSARGTSTDASSLSDSAQAHEPGDFAPGLALLAQAGDMSLPSVACARCLAPTRRHERCVRDGRRRPLPDCPPLQCGLIGGPMPVGSAPSQLWRKYATNRVEEVLELDGLYPFLVQVAPDRLDHGGNEVTALLLRG